MKKPLSILLILLVLPLTATAFMSVGDDELEEVSAQSGLNLGGQYEIHADAIRWTDDDGNAAVGGGDPGYLQFSNVDFSQNGGAITFNTNPIRIDSGSSGISYYIRVNPPDFADLELSVDSIELGGPNPPGTVLTRNLGSLDIDGLDIDQTDSMFEGLSDGIWSRVDFRVTDGVVAWGDSDGFSAAYSNIGYLSLDGIKIDDGTNYARFSGELHAGSAAGQARIRFSDLWENALYIEAATIEVGNAPGVGNSLGSLTLGNLTLDASSSNYIDIQAKDEGLTISGQLELTNGYLAWGDQGGFGTYTSSGYISLGNNTFDDGSGGVATLPSVDLDVGAIPADTRSWLIVNVPTLTIANLSVASARISPAEASGNYDLGMFQLENLSGYMLMAFGGYLPTASAYSTGLRVISDMRIDSGTLIWWDSGGYGAYSTTGYLNLTELQLTDNTGGNWTMQQGVLNVGTGAGGSAIWFNNSETAEGGGGIDYFRLTAKPALDTTPGTASKGDLGYVSVTGRFQVSGTIKAH